MLVTGCFPFNCFIRSFYTREVSFCGEFLRWTDVNNIFSDAWTKIMKGLQTHKNNIGKHTSQKLCLTLKITAFLQLP